MKTYTRANEQVSDLAKHLIKLFHAELQDAGIRIDYVFVSTDSEDAPALSLHGNACMAIARIIGPKERAKGLGDSEISIDEALWIGKTTAEKEAILDHELHHFELRRNKKGRVKLDPNGRPLLKMRKHDYDIGHFVHIAKRHGAASMEVQQMTRIYLQHKQTLFDFAQDADLLRRLHDSNPSDAIEHALDRLKTLPKGIDSMSITSGGKGVKIDKDGVHPVG